MVSRKLTVLPNEKLSFFFLRWGRANYHTDQRDEKLSKQL